MKYKAKTNLSLTKKTITELNSEQLKTIVGGTNSDGNHYGPAENHLPSDNLSSVAEYLSSSAICG